MKEMGGRLLLLPLDFLSVYFTAALAACVCVLLSVWEYKSRLNCSIMHRPIYVCVLVSCCA